MLLAVNTQQPLHSAPNACPSEGRTPSPSWMQIDGTGGRTPLHLAVTPASIAAFACVLDLGTRIVTENLGPAWGLLAGA